MPPGALPAAGPVPARLRAEFAARVVAWQRLHGRHGLPWQGTRDPYRVWLSEIMLQQTQVTTVLAYYDRFLARFPDVRALAQAPQDEVLAAWSGLGYYSRARNLHRCAQAVVAGHGGRFPPSAQALAELPGIGRSTAAAIAAFCFGERAAILDGNVKRVLTRVLGFDGDLAQLRHERSLWEMATALLPDDGGGSSSSDDDGGTSAVAAYTQGLMDLGATICLVRAPSCLLCPAEALCTARAQGRPQDYPVKTRKLKRSRREHWWLWLEHEGCVWLQQRPDSGVWAGLYSLPEYDSPQALAQALRAPSMAAAGDDGGAAIAPIKHVLTHFDWWLHPHRHRLAARPREADLPGPGRWAPYAELGAYGLPAPLRKLLERR